MEKKNTKTSKKVETRSCKKNSKRVGIAKKEMQGFDISLEEFNSISVSDFDL